MAVSRAPAGTDPAWDTVRAVDVVAFAFTLVFLGWIAFGWGGEALAPFIDFVFFLPLGLAVGWLQLRVASELDDPRDRLAWRLLAAASFARFVSGNVWSAYVLTGRPEIPGWLVVLASFFLVFGNAALLAFPSAALRRVDRLRFGFDGLIVLVGSLLMVWFFAAGPYLRVDSATRDIVYTVGDTLAVVLAAALYLRSSSPLTRLTALFLLAAYILQIVPDVTLRASRLATYRAGTIIEVVWFAVWTLKWVAARRALRALASRRAEATASPPEYRSGVLPYVFVAVTTAALLAQLVYGDRQDVLLLLVGTSALAALLVGRQFVELRERDRLRAAMAREASWFGAVLEHAYDFLALVEPGARVAFASPATRRLLASGAAGDTADALLDALHPEDATRLRALFAVRPFAPTVLTLRLHAPDGSWRDLHCRLTDLRDEPLVGAVVLNGHDITRERQLAGRLREAEEVEALGVFAGGLAHDLNNFLAVVGSHVDLLRHEIPAPRPGVIADVMAMQAATKRATALTSGLLTLSRRKTESRADVDVGALVAERLRDLGPEAPLTIGRGRLTTRADPVALRHAIDAILNEQVATREGSALPRVSVGIETIGEDDARRYELSPGRYVVLRIGGIGGIGGIGEAGARAALHPPRASDSWETAPDDLGTLLVHAAVRESGGALAVDGGAGRGGIAMFLPEAGA